MVILSCIKSGHQGITLSGCPENEILPMISSARLTTVDLCIVCCLWLFMVYWQFLKCEHRLNKWTIFFFFVFLNCFISVGGDVVVVA